MGSWSSGFASLGYSTFGGVVAPQSDSTPVGRVPNRVPIGPKVEDATVDAYSTPNSKFRASLFRVVFILHVQHKWFWVLIRY